jgi:ABC-type nitrate/sulfonate/bicarbonate transport system substrate-binding protein
MSYWCKSSAVMVRADSKLSKLRELKGRQLITGKTTSTYYGFTHFILPAYGMSEKDFRAINSVTTERIPALVAKLVEFAIVQEPASSIAEEKGLAKRLKGVDWCKYDDPPFVIGADPRSVKNHPEEIKSYLRAWLRGVKLYKNNFKEFAKVFHQHLASKGRKASLAVIEKSLKVLEKHPQIDDRFYNYVDKMNKVLLQDRKTRSIANFRGGQGIMAGPMKKAMAEEGWK